jgi:hypothetical protein
MSVSSTDKLRDLYVQRLKDIEFSDQELEEQLRFTYTEEEKILARQYLSKQRRLVDNQLARISELEILEEEERLISQELSDKVAEGYGKEAWKVYDKLKSNQRKQEELKAEINNEFNLSGSDLSSDSPVGDPCVLCLIKKLKLKKRAKIRNEYPGKQKYSNCGVQASAYVMRLVSCPGDIPGIDEETLLNDSMKKKYATKTWWSRRRSGGTKSLGRQNIMKDKGVTTSRELFSRNELGTALKNNRPVILAVEAKYLHPATDDEGNLVKTGWEKSKGGAHAITAVDAKFDDHGQLIKVLISDTSAEIPHYWMNIEDLEKAIYKTPRKADDNKLRAAANEPLKPTIMNVSDKPIKTDCPNSD